jgi:hypothetical protein
MSRHDHPAFGRRDGTNARHLHAVPDHDGNAVVGVFWAIVLTLALVGLVVLAVAGCTAQPEAVPCVGCVITELAP